MKYELVRKIYSIISDPTVTPEEADEKTAAYFEELLYCLLNISDSNGLINMCIASRREALVLKAYIDANIYDRFDIEALSKIIYKCPSQTIRIFKKHYGITPHHYYVSVRIKEASKLLKTTDMPIRDIAFRLGFNDEHYFSTVFKKQTGLTPTEFKLIK